MEKILQKRGNHSDSLVKENNEGKLDESLYGRNDSIVEEYHPKIIEEKIRTNHL